MRQYVCVWQAGYGDKPKTEVVAIDWFAGKGYDEDTRDKICALKIFDTVNLTDLSGQHSVTRVENNYADDRTTALFTAWVDGKWFNNFKHIINYPDGTLISMSKPVYTVLIGNQEATYESLADAEKYLWNNWVAGEKEAGQI